MVYILGIIIILVIFVLYTFTPGGARREARENFYGYFYAEGGVTDENDVPYSKEAFNKCIENGIGIKVNVYHSEDMKMFISEKIGVDGVDITDVPSDELTEKGYMKLADFLNDVDGKVPVVAEIKPTKDNEKNCRLVADIINNYPYSNCAVASLHAGTIAWYKHTEKSIFRMLMSAPARDFAGLSKMDAFMNGNLLKISACRPQIVVYRNKPYSALVKFAYAFGTSHGTFTITDKETAEKLYDEMDVIFIKNFMPENGRYKEMPEIEKSQAEIDREKRKEAKLQREARKREIEKRVEEEKLQKKKAKGEIIPDKKAAYFYDEDEFGPVDMTYVEESETPAETETKTEENTEN